MTASLSDGPPGSSPPTIQHPCVVSSHTEQGKPAGPAGYCRHDSTWLLRLGHKRHCGHHLARSGVTRSGKSQWPRCEDLQLPCGEATWQGAELPRMRLQPLQPCQVPRWQEPHSCMTRCKQSCPAKLPLKSWPREAMREDMLIVVLSHWVLRSFVVQRQITNTQVCTFG